MSDVIIFSIGCLVSLLVLGAVALLLWGAANEPGSDEVSARVPADRSPRTNAVAPERTLSPGLESKSPA